MLAISCHLVLYHLFQALTTSLRILQSNVVRARYRTPLENSHYGCIKRGFIKGYIECMSNDSKEHIRKHY